MPHKLFTQSAIKLPFEFDGNRMKEELESISDSFTLIKNQFTGNTLLGVDLIEQNKDGLANEDGETFTLTKHLQKCDYLIQVLATFKCNKFTFRAQNLLVGGKIGLHRDSHKGVDNHIVRLNIPVATNDEVYIYYNNERIPMKSGECWLPDVTKSHEMENRSNEIRWQLLVDCDLNDWWNNILKEHGVDIDNASQYANHTLENLVEIKTNFLEMGLDEGHDLLQEINEAILEKS